MTEGALESVTGTRYVHVAVKRKIKGYASITDMRKLECFNKIIEK